MVQRLISRFYGRTRAEGFSGRLLQSTHSTLKEQALICTRRNHFCVPSVSVTLREMSVDAAVGGTVRLHAA